MLDVNKIYKSTNDGLFEVLSYEGHKDVTVRFLSTGTITKCRAGEIVKGQVKDRLKKSVYGVGYIGVGDYNSNSKAYSIWFSMMQRCYSESSAINTPSYKDVFVCDEWHDFQNFAKWFDENHKDGLHLDKDKSENKLYSPDNCLFITQKENTIIATAKEYSMKSPLGEVFNIFNMREFCRGKGLTHSHMCSVHKGKLEAHKGWTKA